MIHASMTPIICGTQVSNLHNWMRACVRFKSTSFCTSWYYDKD